MDPLEVVRYVFESIRLLLESDDSVLDPDKLRLAFLK